MTLVNGQLGMPDLNSQAEVRQLHESGDHYRAAIVEATGDADPYPCSVKELWWVARSAARYAATALLAEARAMGLTDEQWERLRVVAARVAED